jgi:DDE superfamily endonuclease
VICLDELGPESAKTYAGHQPVRAVPVSPEQPAERATQEADYGRRGYGYVFGAFRPATGDALTRCYEGRTIANWTDFLGHVEGWLPTDCERVYAIVDNLNTHRAQDVLRFCLAHPRWEFVFQPVYAAYLNLIEPWWKVLRSLALKGKRFESWQEIEQAVEKATEYWNQHKHPFVWGKRRRHKAKRKPALAAMPTPA